MRGRFRPLLWTVIRAVVVAVVVLGSGFILIPLIESPPGPLSETLMAWAIVLTVAAVFAVSWQGLQAE